VWLSRIKAFQYLVQFAKFAPAGGYPESLGRGTECVQLFGGRREAAGGEEVQLEHHALAHHLPDGPGNVVRYHPDHRLRRQQDL